LVRRVIDQGRPVAHVAAEMNVSRATGHKWLARWRAGGPAGLADRPSRAPGSRAAPRRRWRRRSWRCARTASWARLAYAEPHPDETAATCARFLPAAAFFAGHGIAASNVS
jgi:transposase